MPKLNQWTISADATNRHARTANGTRLRIRTARTIWSTFTLFETTRDWPSVSVVMSGQFLRGHVFPALGVGSKARSPPRWLCGSPDPSGTPDCECESDESRSERRVDDQ